MRTDEMIKQSAVEKQVMLLVYGLLFGFVFSLVFSLIVRLTFGLDFSPIFGLTFSLVAGLVFGCAFSLDLSPIFGIIVVLIFFPMVFSTLVGTNLVSPAVFYLVFSLGLIFSRWVSKTQFWISSI